MAIIVNKEEKRKNIALSCTQLLLDKGFSKLRISEIAINAGVGKGTIYDYFKNKEDVVFEIIRNLINEHQNDLKIHFSKNRTCKQKVLHLFDFYLCEHKDYSKHLVVYKEFMSVTLATRAGDMHAFNHECSSFIKETLVNIFEDGVRSGELKVESMEFIDGILCTERGFMIKGWTENINCRDEFKQYINALFVLIGNKE